MSTKVKNPITGKSIAVDGKAFKDLISKGFCFDKETEEWEYPEGYEIPEKKSRKKQNIKSSDTKSSEDKQKVPKSSKNKESDSKSKETKKTKNPITGKMIVVGGKAFKDLINQKFEYDEDNDEWTTPDDYEPPVKETKQSKKTKNPVSGKEITIGGKAFKDLISKGFIFDEETEEWEIPEDIEIPEKKTKRKQKDTKPSNSSDHNKITTKSSSTKKQETTYSSEEEEEDYD